MIFGGKKVAVLAREPPVFICTILYSMLFRLLRLLQLLFLLLR